MSRLSVPKEKKKRSSDSESARTKTAPAEAGQVGDRASSVGARQVLVKEASDWPDD
jgi:hypothetical protein